jgi:hypothetical protein
MEIAYLELTTTKYHFFRGNQEISAALRGMNNLILTERRPTAGDIHRLSLTCGYRD